MTSSHASDISEEAAATSEAYWRYWGKCGENGSWHPLVLHSLDVAAVGHELVVRDATVRRRLSQLSGLAPEILESLVPVLLSVHDCGKFSASFQGLVPDLARRLQRLERPPPYTRRHDALAVHLWRVGLGELLVNRLARGREGSLPVIRECLDAWFRPVAGHHGSPADPAGGLMRRPEPFGEPGQRHALEWAESALDLLGVSPVPAAEPAAMTRSSWILAGLAVIADWLGSNVEFFPYADGPRDLATYYDAARVRARSALDQAGLLPSRARPTPAGMRALFPAYRPTAAQHAADTLPVGAEPELLIVEEPTGSGKTEAALAWAHRKLVAGAGDGIYLALPTMATANAMHDRVEPLVTRLFDDGEKPSLALAHSAERLARWLASSSPSDRDYSPSEASATNLASAWLSDNRKKALLASVGVGTVDQALLSVLPVRYSSLRLAGVVRKVLIIDEVHAYDGYTARLLEVLLEFQAALGGSAVLLSATLPAAMRVRFLDAFARGTGQALGREPTESRYPLLSCLRSGGSRTYSSPACRSPRSVRVALTNDQDEVTDRLLEVSQSGGCACWIRNSVADAVAGVAALRERGCKEVTLFHARFALGHRLEIEREVVQRFGKTSDQASRAGRIVIATQVVEQSLDLDFDCLVSDLAPIDLLIQRSGRARRHVRDALGNPATSEGRGEAELVVFGPQLAESPAEDWVRSVLPRTALVYPDHGRLWLSAKALQAHGTIDIPGRARELVESVYGESAEARIPEALLRASQKAQAESGADRSLAELNALCVNDGYRVTLDQWWDDATTPTRLGLPTVQARLGTPPGAGNAIEPLVGQGAFGWQLSQVSVPAYWVPQCPQPEWETAVESAEQAMPDRGRYSTTIVMEADADAWRCRVYDAKGDLWSWSYDRRLGLMRVEGVSR